MIEKQFLQLKNGEKLAYLKAGNGPKVVLMIHGNYASSYQYLPLLEKLDPNYTAYAIDLRGYGDSTYYRHINSLKDFAEDISYFIRQLEIEKFYLIGIALGGGVSLQISANLNDKVEKLILISSTTYQGYPLYKKDSEGNELFGDAFYSAKDLAEDPVQVKPIIKILEEDNFDKMKEILEKSFYQNSKIDKDYLNLLVKEALKQRNLADADFALASFNMSNQHNFYNAGTNDISKVKCPVLHFVGSQDPLTPKYMVLDNYYALKGQSELIEYPNCGHSILVDNIDKIQKQIFDFLNK